MGNDHFRSLSLFLLQSIRKFLARVFVAVQKSPKRKKFEKCWILLQLPPDASTLANTLLMNSLLFTAGLLGPKSHRNKRKSTWKCGVASGIHSISSTQAVQLVMGNPNKECGHVMWRSATILAKIVTQLILGPYMTDLTISSTLLCWDMYYVLTTSKLM